MWMWMWYLCIREYWPFALRPVRMQLQLPSILGWVLAFCRNYSQFWMRFFSCGCGLFVYVVCTCKEWIWIILLEGKLCALVYSIHTNIDTPRLAICVSITNNLILICRILPQLNSVPHFNDNLLIVSNYLLYVLVQHPRKISNVNVIETLFSRFGQSENPQWVNKNAPIQCHIFGNGVMISNENDLFGALSFFFPLSDLDCWRQRHFSVPHCQVLAKSGTNGQPTHIIVFLYTTSWKGN